MKNLILFCLFLISVSCKGQARNIDKKSMLLKMDSLGTYKINLINDSLYIVNNQIKSKDFNPPKFFKDSIVINCNTYLELIDTLYFTGTQDVIFHTIVFGLNQHLTDETEGYKLDFRFKIPEIKLEGNNNIFIMKGLSEIKTQNGSSIEDFIQQNYWETIRNNSYKIQKEFFKNVVLDKDYSYEYKRQASEFLKKKKSDFKTLDDLQVEIIREKIELKLDTKGLRKRIVFTY
jgi:hypothetical protein